MGDPLGPPGVGEGRAPVAWARGWFGARRDWIWKPMNKNQKRKKKLRTKALKTNENWMPNWLLGLAPTRAPVSLALVWKLKHYEGVLKYSS